MLDISSLLLLSIFIAHCLIIIHKLSRFHASCTSLVLTESTIAYLEKIRFNQYDHTHPTHLQFPHFNYSCLKFYNRCVYVTTYKCRQKKYLYYNGHIS